MTNWNFIFNFLEMPQTNLWVDANDEYLSFEKRVVL